MSPTSSPSPVVILGGGLTGLAAAYLAAKGGASVTVLEASDKVGGLLGTFPVGDVPLEHFYHHHFRGDVEFIWLLQELGIADALEFRPTTMGVYREGKFFDFNTPLDLLKFAPLSFIDKFRFGLTSLYLAKFCDWRQYENVSALAWFTKFAGRAVTDSLWGPMLAIKFGDYASSVPLAWMIGRLRQRVGSRKGAQEQLGYIKGSLRTVLVALEARLKSMGVTIVTRAPVEKFLTSAGRVSAVVAAGVEYSASAVIATVPTNILAPLVTPLDATYAASLARIEYFGAICGVVQHTRALSGIYWLNVADAGYPFGGVIEHTNFIPPSVYGGRHISYLSRYLPLSHPLMKASLADVRAEFLAGLKRLYPTLTDAEITDFQIFRTTTAATVCDLNFSQKVPAFVSPIAGLTVASMPHIYPDERSCNNCVRVAANALGAAGLPIPSVPCGKSLSGLLG